MKAALIWFLLVWGSNSQTSVQVTSEEECRSAVKVITDNQVSIRVRAACVAVPADSLNRPEVQSE